MSAVWTLGNTMSRVSPDPVEGAPTPPAGAEIVVVGGGIIGVATAYFLAQRGVSVTLCEKGLIGAEQSARNWGWVRQMGRDVAELPLAIESLRLWRTLNERIGAETGFRQTGITYLCANGREMESYEAWLPHALAHRVDSRLVTARELSNLLPGIAGKFAGGLHTATDGCAEPLIATAALARAAAQSGAHLVQNCAVRGIERQGGSVSGVVTERGTIRCRSVVVAGGAWSRLFLGNAGIDFPQLKIQGTVARIGQVSGVPQMPVGGSNFAFRQRLDGGYTVAMRNANVAPIVPDSFRLFAEFVPTLIRQWRELKLRVNGRFIEEWQMPRHWALDETSPFERVRILDPDPVEHFNREGLANLARAFPAFGGAQLLQQWSGLIDVTPDAVPVIGPASAIPGLFLASGFSGHGFGIGPGAGQLMADLVMGETPSVDPVPFKLERFQPRARAARAASENVPATSMDTLWAKGARISHDADKASYER